MKKIYLLIFLFVYLQNFAQIASYNFTNGSGVDITGHGNNGTLYGNSNFGDTLLIGLNTTDFFEIPSSILNGRIEFSLFFRIKFNALNFFGSNPTNHLFSGDLPNLMGSFAIAYEKDINTWYFVNNGFVCSFIDATVVPESWYCVSITRSNDGLISLWINGIKHSTTFTNTTPLAMNNFIIGQETDCFGGCFATNQASNAKFDYISIYASTLSVKEINAICNSIVLDTKEINKNNLSFFPNPVINNLNVNNATAISKIEILSIDGSILYQQFYNKQSSFDISMKNFISGIYLVKVVLDENVSIYKIYKE